jgi:hypothetical protein
VEVHRVYVLAADAAHAVVALKDNQSVNVLDKRRVAHTDLPLLVGSSVLQASAFSACGGSRQPALPSSYPLGILCTWLLTRFGTPPYNVRILLTLDPAFPSLFGTSLSVITSVLLVIRTARLALRFAVTVDVLAVGDVLAGSTGLPTAIAVSLWRPRPEGIDRLDLAALRAAPLRDEQRKLILHPDSCGRGATPPDAPTSRGHLYASTLRLQPAFFARDDSGQ